MENETTNQTQQDSSLMYVIGAIIVIAIVVAAIVMWPKTPKKQTEVIPTPKDQSNQQVQSKPAYTKLICEQQWYNPVVGYPKFYLSAQGGNVAPVTSATCSFTVYNGTDVVGTEKVNATIKDAPERNGVTIQCTTKAIEKLPVGVPLKMVTVIEDNQKETASCSGNVTLQQQ